MSGRDLLLEYAFPIEAVEPLAAPSATYLKNVCVVAKPKAGQEANVGTIYECLTMAAVSIRTDNTNAQQLFNAGMTKVHILLADDLDLVTPLLTASTFFTLLISDDFDKDDVEETQATGTATISSYSNLLTTTPDTITVAGVVFTAQSGAATLGTATFQAATSNDATAISLAAQINAHATTSALVTALATTGAVLITAIEAGSAGNDIAVSYADNGGGNIGAVLSGLVDGKLSGGDGQFVGTWAGIIGISSDDMTFLEAQALMTNRTAFFGNSTNKAKNMFYAFGKLLSNLNWANQQYIEMPFNDGIDSISEAEDLFDGKISFVINSTEYGNKLSLFANNSKAIIAPYIFEYFQLSLQGWGVNYIALNQPKYTLREASLLQDYLEEKAEERFVASEMVEEISIKISLVEDNFMANGDIIIAEPKALWRVNSVLQQGII
jgi:hypothetical protein